MFQDQQRLPTALHTLLNNLTEKEDIQKEEEATVEEITGVDGTTFASAQPDTTSLVILLVGSLVLFLFYLALKYYTTDSFRWITDWFLLSAFRCISLVRCCRCSCRKPEEREIPAWERRPSSPVLGMAAVVARFNSSNLLDSLFLHSSCFIPYHSFPSSMYLLNQDAKKDSGAAAFL